MFIVYILEPKNKQEITLLSFNDFSKVLLRTQTNATKQDLKAEKSLSGLLKINANLLSFQSLLPAMKSSSLKKFQY